MQGTWFYSKTFAHLQNIFNDQTKSSKSSTGVGYSTWIWSSYTSSSTFPSGLIITCRLSFSSQTSYVTSTLHSLYMATGDKKAREHSFCSFFHICFSQNLGDQSSFHNSWLFQYLWHVDCTQKKHREEFSSHRHPGPNIYFGTFWHHSEYLWFNDMYFWGFEKLSRLLGG